jgi:hypothetical protein
MAIRTRGGEKEKEEEWKKDKKKRQWEQGESIGKTK